MRSQNIRHTDHVGKHLSQNIAKSIDKTNLSLARVRKYARKARACRCAYARDTSIDHEDIERFVKKQKAHRGADRQDAKWLNQN